MHATLADVLLDIVQNGLEAGADRVDVVLTEEPEEILLRVTDDGKGMDRTTLEGAADPFSTDGIKHPGRRVGLGLPFLRQTAEQTGGSMTITSEPGRGTVVEARFPADHWDRPPLGDPVDLWVPCLSAEGGYRMRITRTRRRGDRTASYEVERDELREVLGGLDDVGALGLMRDYLRSLEDALVEEAGG